MSFDHREPGTDPAAWTGFLDGLDAPAIDLAGTGSVVVVAPHPDDETLGAGGLIAAAAAVGVPVHVLLLTRGERSHPDSPTTTPEALAAAVARLLDDPVLAARIGAAGRARVVERFTWRAVAQQTVAWYRKNLEEK